MLPGSRDIYDALPDAVIAVRADGRIVFASAQAEVAFGYDHEELVGGPVERLLSELLRDVHVSHRAGYVANPRRRPMGASYNLVARRKDGSEFPVDIALSPLEDEAGLLVVAVIRDVTERVRAQEALRESEARFRTIFESAQIGMCIVDAGGHAVTSNRAFQEMLGYGADEIARMAFAGYTYPDDREANLALWQELLEGGRDGYELEKRYVRKDRSILWGQLICRAVRDAEGNPEVCFKMVADVTARRDADEQARISNERFQLAASAVSAAVYDWDISSRLCLWSEGLTIVFGYPLADVSPHHPWWEERIHPDDRDDVVARLRERVARGRDWEAEYRFRARDGRYLSVLDRGLVVHDHEGSARRMVGGMVDLTERKALEEQFFRAQRMESVGKLAGGIAHDFNNVLTVVSGYAEFIRSRAAEGDPIALDAGEIQRAAGRAATLVRQLLAYSRRQLVQPRVISLNEAVAEMQSMLLRALGEDVEVVTVLDPALGHVRIDPAQLEQIILNLAVNARDAMPAGGKLTIETANAVLGEAYARTHIGASPGRHVLLAVTDTGAGMDEDTRTHVFEPFFTTKEERVGSGLGLATVYGTVKQCGGSIWVDSEPGRGARFEIYLPRVDEPLDTSEETGGVAPVAGGSETILVVEDDQLVRQLVVRILRGQGYAVLEAADAAEAESLAREHAGPIHLLVTDVVMPGGDGIGLAGRLAETRPETKVVYMSGYAERQPAGGGLFLPGAAFLAKPFTPSDLLRKVRDALDATRAPRA